MPEDIPGGDMSACMNIMMDEEGHGEDAAARICEALAQEAKADNGDVEALRESLSRARGLIADVGVDLNSAVDRPAINSKWTMFKSVDEGGPSGSDTQIDAPLVMKQDGDLDGREEKRIAYAPAMIPREVDKEGDVVGTATVEQAAHDYLKQDGGVDADHDLIDHEKYKGVELTEEGETVALEVIRHHRLLETYLTEHLDYDWHEVHDEADALEHHISEEFERRVAEALDNPSVDPHGDPIPGVELDPIEDDDADRLTEFEPGDHVVVARVSDRDEDELTYLEAAGITPGTELEITDIAPFGMVTVETADGDEQSLPESVARSIRVEPVDEAVA